MRYMAFGDVHGNIDALETALAAAQARGVEAYLFVGDLIGYGPRPLECIERLAALQDEGKLAWVIGNHELAVRGEIDPADYNEEARRTLEWTRSLVEQNAQAKQFIASGEVTLFVDGAIWLAHDSLAGPTEGHYHRWPQNAKSELACLRYKGGRVCLYGHTHALRAELLRQGEIVLAPMEAVAPTANDPRPLRLRTGELGWIGTGSVGFPTNERREAEFLIVDDQNGDEWLVEKYAVPYNRERARTRARSVLSGPCGEQVAERIARWL